MAEKNHEAFKSTLTPAQKERMENMKGRMGEKGEHREHMEHREHKGNGPKPSAKPAG
jgi:hypothetical protein